MEEAPAGNFTVLIMNLTTAQHANVSLGQLPTAMHDSISHVHLYIVPIVVLVGLVTNISCGMILTLSNLRRLPLTVLLASCVFSDALFLVGLFCTWLATGPAVVHQDIQWCYFISMLTNTAHFISTWSHVAVLVHCYIIVATSTVFSGLLAKAVAIGITIVAVVIYVNVTLLTDAQSTDEVSFCRPLAAFMSVTQLLNRLGLLVNTVFPYLLSVTLIVLCLRIIKCESYVLVNFSGPKTQDVEKASHQDDFSRNELSSRLAEAICYVSIIALVLSLPSLLLRVIHTLKEIFMTDMHVQDGELISQSIAQYLVYVTYTLKSLLLPFLWYPYRNMSAKIVRRLLRLLGMVVRCKRRPQLDAMAVLWSHNARVNLISYPHVKVTDV